jgi:GNAT superfamily N-acetyltransferase
MELYAAAQKELYNREVIYNNDGYIVFKPMQDNSMYIHMIYVARDKRKSNVGIKLLNTVIEKYKPKSIVGYVDLTTTNPELSISTHIHNGAKIIESTPTSITFYKELN